MSTFKVLLLAHLLGDFPLQTNRIFRMKIAGNRGLILHVTLHLLVATMLIPNFWQHWLLLLVLGLTHFLTDWTKVRLQPLDKPQLAGYVLDQIMHLFIIACLSWWNPEVPAIFPDDWLDLAIWIALVPAILMSGWVWANDMCEAKTRPDCKPLLWACQRLLPISQQVGWMVVLFVLGMELFV